MLRSPSGSGSLIFRLVLGLTVGALLASCGSAAPSAGKMRSQAFYEARGRRICIRVPSENQLEAARSAVARLAGRASVSVDISLECGGSQPVLYLINATDKGVIYQSLNVASIPRTVECCNGLVPMELNPSMLAAPLYYFALDDDAERARSVAAKAPDQSFFDFNERRSAHPLKVPDGLYQPGYAVFRGRVPREGACVIIVNLADRFQRPDRLDYKVSNQTFACVAKLLGKVNMRTPQILSDVG